MNASAACRLSAWAWRTPLGDGEEALARLARGETALSPAPPELGYPGLIARIPTEPARSPHARILHRAALHGLEIALPLGRAWLATGGDPDRLGVFTALGGLRALWDDLVVGLHDQAEDGGRLWANGLSKVHPYWMLRHLSNNSHALLAMGLGARGEGATLAGPTGGAAAIAAAGRTLAAGRIDAALVLAVDTLIQPEILLEGLVSGSLAPGAGEAAVAMLLLSVNQDSNFEPSVMVRHGLGEATEADPLAPAMGLLGAASAPAQVVALAGRGPGRWTAQSGGAPGLMAEVVVEVGEPPSRGLAR